MYRLIIFNYLYAHQYVLLAINRISIRLNMFSLKHKKASTYIVLKMKNPVDIIFQHLENDGFFKGTLSSHLKMVCLQGEPNERLVLPKQNKFQNCL